MPNILGINLSPDKPIEARKKIVNWLESKGSKFVVTPNPEIILASHQDEEFFYILNKADLSLPDGIGLKIAARIFGSNLARITGSDTTNFLLQVANEKKYKILILNWKDGLSSATKIQQALKNKFPNLTFLVLDISRELKLSSEIIQQINNFSPVLLFCTLGFPYQEKLIYHNLSTLPTVRVAMGVGGTFDFLSGQARRAPLFLRYLGLEWFWRLLIQPQRYKRIFQATFSFLVKVLKAKFINRFRYRPNVVCFLYKNTDLGPQVLIVEREDDPNHWQLPQGGTDHEDLIMAGKRELREETGVVSIEEKAIFKNVHRYKFLGKLAKKSYRINDAYESKKYKYDYCGQKQSLFIAKFIGSDEEIKINFWDHTAWKWVPAENLVSSVHSVRQAGAQKFLDKFLSLQNK